MEQLLTFDEIDGFEVCRATKAETGLPYDVIMGINRKDEKDPCLGIETKKGIVLIPIAEKPAVLFEKCCPEFRPIITWIDHNREILMLHWRKKLTDRELLNIIANNC